MSSGTFFAEQTTSSRVKACIVSNYFDAWANIIQGEARRRGQPIGYLDLFAGRGEYEDGAESTPLLVLRKAINNKRYRDLVEARFNEADPCHAASLRSAIDRLPGRTLLRFQPEVFTEVVDSELTARLEAVELPAVLTFADPFGYKGLSRRLVQAMLRSWGSEVILFFNFNRVNAALYNDCVAQHIDELFGAEEAQALRKRIATLPAKLDKEQAVLDHLKRGLYAVGGRFAQHFAFTNRDGNRTSHYLVHVSKNAKGYHVMKGIMARASSSSEDGVPSFRCGPRPQPSLFSMCISPLDELKRLLLADYAGLNLTVGDVWQRHSIHRQFIERNYKDAIRELEEEGRVVTECPAGQKRRKNTVPDWLVVYFPPVPG